ncbi:unnamed protein product [Lactuca virosa]|uniref:Uncharacterized protein n=1 Tax=Lactuca virosa TaxID=75947 RepID=A0AAU9NLS9_9ASTR|nr:unnamed protein product [Lactuca virosa]
MEKFQTTYNPNTTTTNEAMKSLGNLFKNEKTKLQEIHTGLKTDHEAFQTSVSSQISKLQEELEKESALKETLAIKTEEVKELGVKLNTSENRSMICYLRGQSCEAVSLFLLACSQISLRPGTP